MPGALSKLPTVEALAEVLSREKFAFEIMAANPVIKPGGQLARSRNFVSFGHLCIGT
jgi:hypothetical protein